MAGAEELLAPALRAPLAPLLAAAKRRLVLALTADGVERLVGAADEVERIADDLRLRQLLAQGLPIGVVGSIETAVTAWRSAAGSKRR